jgi:hypothetical protein
VRAAPFVVKMKAANRAAPKHPEANLMQYLLTIYTDEAASGQPTREEGAAMMDAYMAFGEEASKAGVMVGGNGLQPASTATTVRVRDGERLITDGPFAETKEQLGGYYLLDCENLDDAIAWAAKIPGASSGSVEVRPVMVYDEVPA